MSAPKKPRADSVLKTLPPDRQAAIIEHLRTNKLADTVAWLLAEGIKTSVTAPSLFPSWSPLPLNPREAGDQTDANL